ncbi:MAG: BlaI/MecI/CopY family transcriptional regulator [Bacteroidetes bacterium]|jgi:BlaI family transcriptional regulator, penicillinase repressor|nr:BlaI/MecI/CopY family transcriptional regulator [Bacteroidota bacterium]MBT6687415.1 BlaI/MecI/CopY family transcriptional regulator [Bacteroidota bacterium]MBT7144901.1 BlaI/MecI/CopY family transcriptional regulator [Bacteroidota bacterium]MBT7493325.1 BlaI/MecI/CopY family transcriptional regulator [Bacteroidota bacterium]
MKMKKLKPTESELEILQILWKCGASSVRFVNDELNKNKQVGYTTSLKIMQIMADKNLVSRIKDGRTHIYSAAIEQKDTQNQLLKKLVDGVFAGSAKNLVMQALGNHEASKSELEEIRKFINDLEEEKS